MRKPLLLSLLVLCMAFSATSGISRVNKAAFSLPGTLDTVTVTTLDSLKSAIATATTDRLILLRKCTDAAGYYALGTAGLNYPTVFVSLELKNYPGDTATLYGSFTSTTTRTMKLNSLVFDGLTFQRVATGDGEGQTPFYFLKPDTLNTGMYVRNCTFKDLGGSGSSRLFYAKSAGVKCGEVVFENNIIDNFGGATADKAHGQTMFQFANYLYSCDKLIVRNNLIRDYHGNQFINNSRQTMPTSIDSSMSITVEGNSFIRFGGNGTSDRNFIEWTNKMAGVKAYITIKDNLFYKNWSTVNKKCYRLHLFNKDSAQVQEVRVLNNYFDPSDVVFGLPITNTSKPLSVQEYKNFSKESFAIINTFIDDSLLIMSTKSPLYTASTTGGPIGLDSMYTSSATEIRTAPLTLQVNCVTGLKNAIANAFDGDTIELLNSVDAGSIYNLGTTGFVYPSSFINLTLKPAEGNTPVLFGSFRSSAAANRMKIKTLTVDGLSWDATDMTDSENAAPFFMQAGDSIMNALNLVNCSFINMGKSGGARIIDANSCDKSVVKAFNFENNVVENFGNATALNAHGQTFMQWRNSGTYEFDNITLRNNIIHNWHGNQFVNVGRNVTNNPDSTLNITIENNTFYKFGGNGTSARNLIETPAAGITGTKKVNIKVNNNLFYKNIATNHRSGKIQVTNSADSAIVARYDVQSLNNFFYSDSVACPSPTSTYKGINLPIVGTPVYKAYKALMMDSIGLKKSPFVDEAKADSTLDLTIWTSNPLFKAGIAGTHIGARAMYVDRTSPMNQNITTLAELKTGILYAVDGDTLLIENCQDAGGVYNLGTAGFAYPSQFINLTLKAAADHTPVLFGSFRSATLANRMKLNTMTVEGLTWNATGMTDSENAAPFYMLASDSIMGSLNIRNCSFINLGKSGGGRIIDANSCDKSVVKAFFFEGNLVDNFGYTTADNAHGQTLMQWRNSGTYEFDNITLKNNTFRCWHGNQFVNVGRNVTNNPDSTLNIRLENNTFYKFGGNGTSARNLVETPNGGINGTKKVNINVNNNLFYKNYANNHRSGKIQVTNSADSAIVARYEVSSLNNYFYGDSVACPTPTATYKGMNLPVVGTPVYKAYKAFTKDSLGITVHVFVDEAKADTTMDLTMYKQTPLFTSGVGGVCIGDPRWYTSDATPPVGIANKKTEVRTLNGYASNGMIFVKGAEKPVVLYNIIGQKLGTYTVEEAERGISIRNQGLVIVHSDGKSLRLMVR